MTAMVNDYKLSSLLVALRIQENYPLTHVLKPSKGHVFKPQKVMKEIPHKIIPWAGFTRKNEESTFPPSGLLFQVIIRNTAM